MPETIPPEPRSGDAVSPTQFPGAGFVGGEIVDYDAINAYAERVGWRCRFRRPTNHDGWEATGPVIYYP